jgi:hypothetical protein
MTVTMQSTHVLRQLAREREAMLRATPLLVSGERGRVRRWLGRQLVRLGTRLAGEPTMRPVRAR